MRIERKKYVLNGVPLKGKSISLNLLAKMNVVDYKTGDPDKERKTYDAANNKNPTGGDYWRRLYFIRSLLIYTKKNGM